MNKRIPSLLTTLLIFLPLTLAWSAETVARSDEYADFNPGHKDKGKEWVQAIVILSPALRAEVKGDTKVEFQAKGMAVAQARCWQQPTPADSNPFGHDVVLVEMKLDPEGKGSFVFRADQFPNGPISIRILANDQSKTRKDMRELQLYNTGGVVWEQGLPATAPLQAAGMKLIFSDDFDKELSISKDGEGKTYTSHKPGGGDFSGWPFSDYESDLNPFSRVGTFLRIRASKRADGKSSSGLISPARMDFSGAFVSVPYFMECRLIAQSAPGTWPAFWTLTRGGAGCDELDILEAYGGNGVGNPNYTGYSTTSHYWDQKGPDGKPLKAPHKANDMLAIGGKSSWSHTFHNYGLQVTETDTIYYLDGIETLRHPTNEVSKNSAHFFLINYAIGGISGWKIDLEREGNMTDMYVDWVRVYSAKPAPTGLATPKPVAALQTDGIGLNFSVAGDASTELKPEDVTGEPAVSQSNWNNLAGAGGTAAALKDQRGGIVPGISAVWSVPEDGKAGRSGLAREWGFTGADLRLQKGCIQSGGRITVSAIPYANYDVVVYVNAGDNSGMGSVSISSAAGVVDPNKTYFFNLGWLGGKFVRSAALSPETAKNGSCVVFSGNSAKEFTLEWNGKVKGGWTGVTGLQIIAKP